MGDRVTRGHGGTDHVDVELTPPIGRGELFDPSRNGKPGIRDCDIETAERTHDLLYGFCDRCLVGDVASNGKPLGASRLELFHHLSKPVFPSSRHRHGGAFIRETQGERTSDPAAAARDPNNLVVETFGHDLRVAAPRVRCHGPTRRYSAVLSGVSSTAAAPGSVAHRFTGANHLATRAARSTSSRYKQGTTNRVSSVENVRP